MTSRFEIVPGLWIGADDDFVLFGGPCVIEDEATMLRTAAAVADACRARGVGYVFKASFDKANRTSISSARGPGMQEGLDILAKVKAELGLPVLTDIHEPHQAAPVAEVADVLQIPAFLCRQTDLLAAAAATGAVVKIKKGQFVSAAEMEHAARKVVESGGSRVILTERGTFFGYHDLVVDFRSLPRMRRHGWPVVFDATHSVQQPGGAGGSSGGRREYVPHLACAAAAVGIDGLFMEIHEDPDHAPSDGPNMVRLADLPALLDRVVAIRAAAGPIARP